MESPKPLERGRNFRLLSQDELPKLLDFLEAYLPESLKVKFIHPLPLFLQNITIFTFCISCQLFIYNFSFWKKLIQILFK